VYAVGSGATATIYAAAYQGLSVSTNGGANWTNYTDGLGGTWSPTQPNSVNGVYASGNTIYAATGGTPGAGGGVSISPNPVVGGNGGNGGYAPGGIGGAGGPGGTNGGTNGTAG
jgi:hypothetical protein